MLEDETCFFLAADFDKEGWREDAAAFVATCRRMNLPYALKRSRSGCGAHVWIFFEEALPAALARKLGSLILTQTMEQRPDVGLDSYDRFLPNQDTLPQGGFGNLIALPLQKLPREQGNSLFLDDDFHPHADQWAFLSSLRKISRARVEDLVRNAERSGNVVGVRFPLAEEDEPEPWTTPPSRRRKEPPVTGELPHSLELVLGNEIYIASESLTPGLRNRLLRLAAFQNPEFYKAQAMRLSTHGKPRVISCAEEHSRHIGLPRGCLDDARRLLANLGIKAQVRDERNAGDRIDVAFTGELRAEQQPAAEALFAHDTGVLAATTAFGKTVIAARLIAQRGVNTLVLVHRRQLLEQWVQRLSTFLNIPVAAIGRIGGGRRKPQGTIDHPIIFMQCGPVRYRVNAKAQAALRPFDHTVIVRPTGFQSKRPADADPRNEFLSLSRELGEDEARNRMICDDVIRVVRDARSPLVLTERNRHLDALAAQLSGSVRHLVVLRGGAGKKDGRSRCRAAYSYSIR